MRRAAARDDSLMKTLLILPSLLPRVGGRASSGPATAGRRLAADAAASTTIEIATLSSYNCSIFSMH